MSNIYFIAAPAVGMVKIGKASSIHQRLLALQSSSPVELVLLAHISLGDNYDSLLAEQRLHARHDADRSHGEWFRASESVMSDIAAINSGKFDCWTVEVPEPSSDGFRARWLAKRTEAIKAGKAAAKAAANVAPSHNSRRLKKAAE